MEGEEDEDRFPTEIPTERNASQNIAQVHHGWWQQLRASTSFFAGAFINSSLHRFTLGMLQQGWPSYGTFLICRFCPFFLTKKRKKKFWTETRIDHKAEKLRVTRTNLSGLSTKTLYKPKLITFQSNHFVHGLQHTHECFSDTTA